MAVFRSNEAPALGTLERAIRCREDGESEFELGDEPMTAQIGEVLIRDGEKTGMAFCPPLPRRHPRIDFCKRVGEIQDDSPPYLFSTACWRRYQGTWEIKEGRFYLVALRGRYQLRGEEPLFAGWFTGVLRVAEGKLLQYVHMGFGSVYEREVHIKIERGLVTSTRTIDNCGQPHDRTKLAWRNLPGKENRFPGDDEL